MRKIPLLSPTALVAIVAVFLAGGGIGLANRPAGAPQSTSPIPSGMVMFYAHKHCPTGWKEFTSARGRYVVGLPSPGSLEATVGTALRDLENRPTGEHTHTINDPGHTHVDTPTHTHALGLVVQGGHGGFGAFAQLGGGGPPDIYEAVPPPGPGATDPISTEKTGITINDAGTVPGTNAPYIQLLACLKK
jgi:hypothetical protein